MFDKEFETFVDSVQRLKHSNQIVSFAAEIETKKINVKLEYLHNSAEEYFFLTKKSLSCKLLGWNPLIRILYNGSNRIQSSEKEILKLSKSFVSNWSDKGITTFPLFVGGIKFSPDERKSIWTEFHDSEWYIPKFLLYEKANHYYLIYNFKSNETKENLILSLKSEYDNLFSLPENDLNKTYSPTISKIETKDDFAEWKSNVTKALEIINNGSTEKVVLSRYVYYEIKNTVNITPLLKGLQDSYPECHTFAFRKKGSTFFGASPERLASISEGVVTADALAGSVARGKTADEDVSLAQSLLNSKKNVNEQKAVVNFIADSLKDFTEDLQFPIKPSIKKLPNIQHLWTPIKAKLKKDRTVFELLKEIHPTPAICGVPWSKALSFIHDTESHNRGLYAGVIGWFNFNNEAEFIVGLRSGLIKDNKLYAFAGCGIVKGSDPDAEYHESELKLKPILSQFDETAKVQS